MNPNDQQQLEAFVHRALRELPDQRAPFSLENRVFAAIAARQRLPWWQQGWRSWPAVPRTVVLAASAAAVVAFAWLAFSGTHAVGSAPVSSLIDDKLPLLAALRSVAGTVGDSFAALFLRYRFFFIGGLSALAAAYLATIGLGASLYRSIALDR